MEKLEELASIWNQVDELLLPDKNGKQNFHGKFENLLEPMTESNKHVSQDISSFITETSFKNNQAISDLNEKVLELMNDKGMIAPFLVSSKSFNT